MDSSTRTTPSPRRTRTPLVVAATAVAGLAVVATTAPVVAAGLVGKGDLAKGAVTSKAIAKKAVKAKHLADGAVKGTKLADGSVGASKLADASVNGAKVADGSVAGADLAAGSVSRSHLASDLQPLWAVVWGGPSILRGRGAVDVAYEGVNSQTKVTFDRDVSQCSYTATMSQPNSLSPQQDGFLNVSTFSGDPKAVLVRTRDMDGALAPRGFTLHVWC